MRGVRGVEGTQWRAGLVWGCVSAVWARKFVSLDESGTRTGANHQWLARQIRKPQSKSRRRRRKRVAGTSESAIVQVGKPRH